MNRSDRENDRSRRLCAVLGHELRNPLASAITSVSVVRAMMDDSDPRETHLRQAVEDLGRLSSLLSTYLEFGRGGTIASRRIELGEVIRAVASRKACTEVTSEADSIPVCGDPDLLGRALENMIENALQAGATKIQIRLSRREGAAVIEVADDGPGVPVELRQEIFEPFVSGRGSSGLGLAVARDAVDGQGGRIALLEPLRGQGATFQIILPLDERTDATSGEAALASGLVPSPMV